MPAPESDESGPASGSAAPLGRRVLEQSLAGRFRLRWHMALMLGIAFLGGFLPNHLLLATGTAFQVHLPGARTPGEALLRVR